MSILILIQLFVAFVCGELKILRKD